MLALSGLHLLLTYQCPYECDHCFVWGSPRQKGVMTMGTIREILRQARAMPSVTSICFEGGEPFLYAPILQWGLGEAAARGYRTGVVTNAYWATAEEDAQAWLAPLEDKLHSLTLSSDCYHGSEEALSPAALHARAAAERYGIASSVISVAQPEGATAPNQGGVMYRGRAAALLASRAPQQPAEALTCCPHEDLRTPSRVHIDPFGYVHLCQGLCLGNLFETPLPELCRAYDPDEHPIVGPLLAGGPLALAHGYDVPLREQYADACQLCYEARSALRVRFPKLLAPDAMYEVSV